MRNKLILFILFLIIGANAQETQVIRPQEIDDVLINPGIGFMTFQRFNGDSLNPLAKNGKHGNWTEGYPIEYQTFDGNLENKDHPQTSIAYFRVYWKFIEPEPGHYRWDLLEKALVTAGQRGQTLMLRIAPYGPRKGEDIPDWLRKMTGKSENLLNSSWVVDPEDPLYVKHFTDMVRDLGKRYDGHPLLESVDMAIVGYWGEGAGSELLSDGTRKALIDAYLQAFKKTHLVMMLSDPKTNKYGISQRNVGWRVDCLGDMGRWAKPTNNYWNHMQDMYPESIIRNGMRDAWKKAPVTIEVCGVMDGWFKKGYDIDYIIQESLKWHMSSFNAKSSPVPAPWKDKVDQWLKKMGYRFVLRRFQCPRIVHPNGKMEVSTWWENKGDAPCYRDYPLAIRLKNEQYTKTWYLDADIRKWLPGDALYEDTVFLPYDMPAGEYDVEIALVDNASRQPAIKLAIEGRTADGWYPLTRISVVKEADH